MGKGVRVRVLALALALIATGLVWGVVAPAEPAAATDEYSLGCDGGVCTLSVSPPQIYADGVVTYTFTGATPEQIPRWDDWFGTQQVIYERFFLDGGQLQFGIIPWGFVTFSPVGDGCSGNTCTLSVNVTRQDPCRDELGLFGQSYQEQGFDLRLFYGFPTSVNPPLPNPLVVSAPLTNALDVECDVAQEDWPPDNEPDEFDAQGDVDLYVDEVEPGVYDIEADAEQVCDLIGGDFEGGTGPEACPPVEADLSVDGERSPGYLVQHTFSKPGSYPISFEGYNPDTLGFVSASGTLVVRPPPINLRVRADTISDGRARANEEFDVTVDVVTGRGLGDLSQFTFDASTLLGIDSAFFEVLDAPELPSTPTTVGPETEMFTGTWRLRAIGAGDTELTVGVNALDAADQPARASATLDLRVGDPLQLEIRTDPPVVTAETLEEEEKEAVDINVIVTITNDTERPLTDVKLDELDLARTFSGQELLYQLVDPAAGTPSDVLEAPAPPAGATRITSQIAGTSLDVGTLGPESSKVLVATYRISTTGVYDVEGRASATAHTGGRHGATATGRVDIGTDKLLRFESQVVTPDLLALPAGETIVIEGTITNLTSDTVFEVGPPVPSAIGNAGAMAIEWEPVGPPPAGPPDYAIDPLYTLNVGQEVDFRVRIATQWSDPRIDDQEPIGGTFADIEFAPWARFRPEPDQPYEYVDGESFEVEDADLRHRISIDDSIHIPEFEWDEFGFAIAAGTLEGIARAAVGLVEEIVNAPENFYTSVSALFAFIERVWGSFTPEEQAELAESWAPDIFAFYARSAELIVADASEELPKIQQALQTSMNDLAKAWATDGYLETTRTYARLVGQVGGEFLIPIAIGKLAKTPRAAAALARSEAQLAAAANAIRQTISQTRAVRELTDALFRMKSGTRLGVEEISRLFGQNEATQRALQKLADLGYIINVRSRHPRSSEWLERGAAMKPEELKIKTVNEIDLRLGYGDIRVDGQDPAGILVFKKPEPLRRFDAVINDENAPDIERFVADFLQEKGFTPGTVDHQLARDRLYLRMNEWRKHESEYKLNDRRGAIAVNYRYDVNSIGPDVRSNDVKFNTFQLEPVEGQPDTFIVKMGVDGRPPAPVTGDIDAISLQKGDGSPLSPKEHADLLDRMRDDPDIGNFHGDSITFELGGKGGLDFVLEQFTKKVIDGEEILEPVLQFSPFGSPRIARLNVDKSRWKSGRDYHLHYDGGAITIGRQWSTGIAKVINYVLSPTILFNELVNFALGGAVDDRPNYGRCRLTVGSPNGAIALFGTADGLFEVDGGTSVPSPLQETCTSEGGIVDVVVAPASTIADVLGIDSSRRAGTPAGSLLAEASALSAGATVLPVVDESLFSVGDRLMVGAGTDRSEIVTVVGLAPLTVDPPLARSHEVGEVVIAVGVQTASPPTTPTTPTTPATPSTPATPTAPDPPGPSADPVPPVGAQPPGADTPQRPVGALPTTGGDGPQTWLWLAAWSLLVGLLAVVITRRRRSDPFGSPSTHTVDLDRPAG